MCKRHALNGGNADTIGTLRGGIVRRRVRDEAHRDEDDKQVDPYGAIREPAVRLERADLPDHHAHAGPNNDAHGEAELAGMFQQKRLKCEA